MSCGIKGTPKPKASPKYEFTENRQVLIFDQYQKDNLAWLTARTIQRNTSNQSNQEAPAEKPNISTWAAYHSLVGQDTRPTTNVYVLPLVPAPANEWKTLLTVLQQAQHINTQVVGPDRKTVITLDMDLYSRALKLQTLKPDMHKNGILRIGKFHTVLCTLRALGSTIESSGMDEAWVEAGLYGPTTTRQILGQAYEKGSGCSHCHSPGVL